MANREGLGGGGRGGRRRKRERGGQLKDGRKGGSLNEGMKRQMESAVERFPKHERKMMREESRLFLAHTGTLNLSHGGAFVCV